MRHSVLMLLQSEFPPDIRVEKEIEALYATNRFRITLLCNNKTNKSRAENFEQVRVVRLPFWNFSGKKFNQIKNIPLWFNPVWLYNGMKTALQIRPRVIHVHDLPLMFLGLILARLVKAKLVYDLHENYPATFDLWKKGGIFRPLIRNKRLALIYDRFSLTKADGVIVVEPEHIGWIKNHYNLKKPISVVSNTVDLEKYPEITINQNIVEKYQEAFVISYVGQISVERDLDVALKAILLIQDKITRLKFIIVGEGPERKRLQELTNQLKLNDHVIFTGWVPFEETATYIHLSRICLIPQGSNDLIDNGTPHKLFQYMALGKPVIVSDAKAMKRIVTDAKCGLVFKSKDEGSLANAILQLAKNPENYGENGVNAVQQKYNWQKASLELLKLYETLC